MPLIDQDIAALGPILLSVYMLKFLCEAGETKRKRAWLSGRVSPLDPLAVIICVFDVQCRLSTVLVTGCLVWSRPPQRFW